MNAYLGGDTEKALELYDLWMVEITPEDKAELKMSYGDEYEALFEEKNGAIQ